MKRLKETVLTLLILVCNEFVTLYFKNYIYFVLLTCNKLVINKRINGSTWKAKFTGITVAVKKVIDNNVFGQQQFWKTKWDNFEN